MTAKLQKKSASTLEKPAPEVFSIVGIGASAGGFEAFIDFLKHLPEDTGMAFVFVQHLDPTHESKLPDLLARATKLPVISIRHQMQVKPNTVYVLPSNRMVTIRNSRLLLSPRIRTRGHLNLPIDHFLRSLAVDQQNQAIAVILSGTGSDGTIGIEAIKGEGGITLAQDEKSAKYTGMPRSAVMHGHVDFVGAPAEVARELKRISRHPYLAGKPSKIEEPSSVERLFARANEALNTIFSLLHGRNGVDFSLYKHTTLKRRIMRRMALQKVQTVEKYVRLLQESPGEMDALYDDLLINVTSFFRDSAVFQTLKRKVFPKLFKSAERNQALRFWTTGCATGEEAYSLAMAVTEYMDKHKTRQPVQIFATDISEKGLERARAGIYTENIAMDVAPERLNRFFVKLDGSYQVSRTIRDMCIFARQNVITDPPFSNLDLISCRNLLIYLGPALQKKVLPVFHYALKPGGHLLLGSSETANAATDLFGLVDARHKIYCKKSSHRRHAPETFQKPAAPVVPARHPSARGEAPGGELQPIDLQQAMEKIILSSCAPSAVVINSQMDVLQFRGRTAAYLEHSHGAATLNLLKMAKEELSLELRSAISKASNQDKPARSLPVRLRGTGHAVEVTVEVIPFRMAPGSERLFLLIFHEGELNETGPGTKARPRKGTASKENERRIAQLHKELAATKDSLQAIIEEQEATNEELKSANEEIQSSNEELQSTNEELETAKEELQSTNEELMTLNEELQNLNLDLTLANNDLANLLASVNVAILMLGNDLTVRSFTPAAQHIFRLIPSDIGRRLNDINRSIQAPDLEKLIQGVIDNLATVEREVQDNDGHWYSMRIRPYRTNDHKIEGAVLVLMDINELKRAIAQIMGIVRHPLLVLRSDLRVSGANDAFYKAFKTSPKETEGRLVHDLGNQQWNIPRLQTLLEEILPREQEVRDFIVEHEFPEIGHRRISVSARRFYEESRGIQLILLAMVDVTEQGGAESGRVKP